MFTSAYEKLKRPSRRRAFTLVEILMSVSVLALLFIVLINFFRGSLSNYMNASLDSDNLRDTRMAIIGFERDIRESIELLNFDDNARYTNIQLARYEFDPKKKDNPAVEYAVYTFYKHKQNVAGADVPFSICKNVLKDRPQPSDVAIKPLIKGVEKTKGQVGIIPKAMDKANREIETQIAAYNMHYDPSYLNIPFLSYGDKEKERARSRFMGRYNGAMLGFTDKNKIVAIELTIITTNEREKVNVYRSFVYLRKAFYDKLTDGNY